MSTYGNLPASTNINEKRTQNKSIRYIQVINSNNLCIYKEHKRYVGHTSNITQTTVVHEETNLQEGHLRPKIK